MSFPPENECNAAVLYTARYPGVVFWSSISNRLRLLPRIIHFTTTSSTSVVRPSPINGLERLCLLPCIIPSLSRHQRWLYALLLLLVSIWLRYVFPSASCRLQTRCRCTLCLLPRFTTVPAACSLRYDMLANSPTHAQGTKGKKRPRRHCTEGTYWQYRSRLLQ